MGIWSVLFPGDEGALADLFWSNQQTGSGITLKNQIYRGTSGVDIVSFAQPSLSYNPYQSEVYLYEGNDSVRTVGMSSGTKFFLGDGEDFITALDGLRYSRIEGGSGDDTVWIKESLWDREGLFRSTLVTEAGNDYILIEKEDRLADSRTAISGGGIFSGDGDDRLVARGNGLLMQSSGSSLTYADGSTSLDGIINLGEGKDFLGIEKWNALPPSGSMSAGGSPYLLDSDIDLGGGDDTVDLRSLDFSSSKGVLIKGGEGYDVSILPLDISSAPNWLQGFEAFTHAKNANESPSSTFLLATSSSSINEGSTLTTTVATTNVASGTTLYWSIAGTGVTAADFSSGALTGSGVVGTDGNFSFAHTAANDLTTEGDETLQITLFSDSARTVQVGSTATVTLKDTSQPGSAEFLVNPVFRISQSTNLVNWDFKDGVKGWKTNGTLIDGNGLAALQNTFLEQQLPQLEQGKRYYIYITGYQDPTNRLTVSIGGKKAFETYSYYGTNGAGGGELPGSLGYGGFGIIPGNFSSYSSFVYDGSLESLFELQGYGRRIQSASIEPVDNIFYVPENSDLNYIFAAIDYGTDFAGVDPYYPGSNANGEVIIENGFLRLSRPLDYETEREINSAFYYTNQFGESLVEPFMIKVVDVDEAGTIGKIETIGSTEIGDYEFILRTASGLPPTYSPTTFTGLITLAFGASNQPAPSKIEFHEGLFGGRTFYLSSTSGFFNVSPSGLIEWNSAARQDFGNIVYRSPSVNGSGEDSINFLAYLDDYGLFENRHLNYSISPMPASVGWAGSGISGDLGSAIEFRLTSPLPDYLPLREGSSLVAPGISNDPEGLLIPNYSYLWFHNNIALQSANERIFTVPSMGAGSYFVKVTYTDDKGNQRSVSSDSVSVGMVNNGQAAFLIGGSPFIVGAVLSAIETTSDPDGNGVFSYAWQTSSDVTTWSPVGADSSSYTVAAADEGKQIKLVVTYLDAQNYSESCTTTAGMIAFVNEAPTDIILTSSGIQEISAAGTVIGTLAGVDPDVGSTFSYALVAGNGTNDADNALVEIVGNEVRVKSVASIDFETNPVLNLNIRVSDNGNPGLTYTKAVSASVLNADEIPLIRGNSLYTIVDGPSWTQAEANSVKLGGHLVTVNDKNENTFIAGSFGRESQSSHWLGLARDSYPSPWKWVSGQSSDYLGWDIPEPNSLAGENNNYVYMWTASDWLMNNGFRAKGTWNDDSHTPSPPVKGISETPFIRRGDSAYVIVQGPTWEEAEANAVKLGGHLVTINDADENQWISDTFRDRLALPDKNWNNGLRAGSWIGLNDKEVDGVPKWADGTEVTYTNYLRDIHVNGSTGTQDGWLTIMLDPSGIVQTYAGLNSWCDVPVQERNDSWLYKTGIAEIKLAPNNTPTGIPTISGTFKAGQVITIDKTLIQDSDNFTGYTPTFNYSFEVSGDNGTTWTKLTTTDATDNNSTYTLTTEEVGKKVRGVVSYLDGYGTNEVVASAGSTNVIAPSNTAPTAFQTLTGINKVGRVLTADKSTIVDTDGVPTAVSYGWEVSSNGTTWTKLTSADATDNNSTYALTAAELGKTVRSVISYTDGLGTNEVARSTPTSVVLAGAKPTGISLSKSTFAENTGPNVAVIKLSSVDLDTDDAYTYFLVTGSGSTDNSRFSIAGEQLVITGNPDFETKNSYSIRLRTTDLGGLSVDKSFTLKVTNVNEAPDAISLSDTDFQENIASGSVIASLTSRDPDKETTFTYSLTPNTPQSTSTDNQFFSIVNDQLKVNATANFEQKDSYTISVRSTDAGQLFYDQVFTLVVQDIDEAPTDISITGTGIDEGAAVGSLVGSFVTTDQDESSTDFTYELVAGTKPNNNDQFEIVGDQLKTKATFNFETKSSYVVNVRTTDEAGLTFAKSIVVRVNNVNENPTDLTVSATAFNENVALGTTVATLGVLDPDKADTYSYSFVSGEGDKDNQVFLIAGNALKVNVATNFEIQKSYSVRLRVTDQGGLFFDKSVALGVNNQVEKVTSGVSTTLAPDKDTLELTGTKNTFGIGNQFDNTIVGNTGRNKLIGGLGKDTLTGGAGVDTFFYNDLKESLLSGFDVITDYAAADRITVGFAFEGDDLIASTGKAGALTAGAIGSVLSNTSFLANNAAAFTLEGLRGTFLALNDGRDGFQAESDALIHLSNYTIGSKTPISII